MMWFRAMSVCFYFIALKILKWTHKDALSFLLIRDCDWTYHIRAFQKGSLVIWLCRFEIAIRLHRIRNFQKGPLVVWVCRFAIVIRLHRIRIFWRKELALCLVQYVLLRCDLSHQNDGEGFWIFSYVICDLAIHFITSEPFEGNH